MDYLQKWWEEKYPEAGVRKIREVSEGVINVKDLIDFQEWLIENFNIEPVEKESIRDNCKHLHVTNRICNKCKRVITYVPD